jgi:acetylornithine/succinyldiaminopimelate/putrescine aminotransferase
VHHLIDRLADELAAIQNDQHYLTEVRQTGLIVGLRVDHPDGAVYLQQELFERGVWAIASGFDQSVLQFKPGLLLDDADLDLVLERLTAALESAKDVDRPVPRRHGHRSATR